MTHEILQNSGMIPYDEALAWASEDSHIGRIFNGVQGFLPIEVTREDISRVLRKKTVATVSEVVYPNPHASHDSRIVVGCYRIAENGGAVERLFGLLQFGDGSMYVSDREHLVVLHFFSGQDE